MVYLVVYVADECEACKRVILLAETITSNYPNVNLDIKNINLTNKKLTIVPAVFVNENLFCYGEFDKSKLSEVISNQVQL